MRSLKVTNKSSMLDELHGCPSNIQIATNSTNLDDSEHLLNVSCFSHISDNEMISFDSNDSNEKFEPVRGYRPEVTSQIKKVVLNALKHNNPYGCIENSIEILNEVPGAKFMLPTSKFKIKKLFNQHLISNFTTSVKSVKLLQEFQTNKLRAHK